MNYIHSYPFVCTLMPKIPNDRMQIIVQMVMWAKPSFSQIGSFEVYLLISHDLKTRKTSYKANCKR